MKKFLHLGKPYNVLDLNIPELIQRIERRNIPILIIDDEAFAYQQILSNHGFSIKHVKDIEAIEMVSEYEIILCDIKGVGKQLGSRFEGAHLIKEIKKRYPFKYIIAYTGQKHDASFNQYFRIADNMVKKDEESEVWIETLDEAINCVASPKEKWINMRDFMINRGIPLYNIALIENYYVKSIIQNNSLEGFTDIKEVSGLPSDVRAVFNSFISSVIFKLIFG